MATLRTPRKARLRAAPPKHRRAARSRPMHYGGGRESATGAIKLGRVRFDFVVGF
jgi:hypothetical protein